MGIFSIFQGGGKYFDKKIPAKCDYCQFGKRSNAGNKIICEKKGLVDPNYSCGSFIYSPLKRIPVKQLNFVGSLADEDIYIESAGDRAEKEAAQKEAEKDSKKSETTAKPAEASAPVQEEAPIQNAPAEPSPAPAQVSVSPETPAPQQDGPQSNDN